jgi:hypothetical protein
MNPISFPLSGPFRSRFDRATPNRIVSGANAPTRCQGYSATEKEQR